MSRLEKTADLFTNAMMIAVSAFVLAIIAGFCGLAVWAFKVL